MFRLFDTAIGDIVEVSPIHSDNFSMYVCGPTVYDLAHLGHGRYALVFDVLRRYLEWRGLNVRHVSNITDVDDKILDRAKRENRTPGEVALEFEQKWFATMDRLGVLRPHFTPHATEYIAKMISLIDSLIDLDVAYIGEDGVYFDSSKVSNYGLLARQSLESLRAGARIEDKSFKRSPTDFVLWKFDPDASWAWESPWGIGRPGWHTECVVMSTDLLGSEFDLHGGGLDLSFPHHENERAQACAIGLGFSQHWVHNGFVMVGNDKMSKSLGNFTTLDELLEKTDPRAYRLLVLQSHYRSPLEVNPQTLSEASRALSRFDLTFRRIKESDITTVGLTPQQEICDSFRSVMDSDLDTPRAMAELFELRGSINQLLDKGEKEAAARSFATLEHLLGVLGIRLLEAEETELPGEVLRLLEQRTRARAERSFDEADRIRDTLTELGFVIEDTPEGQKVRRL